jgi:type III pantothenate kinase
MILAFDVGNTFAKWGFVEGGQVVAGGRVLHRAPGLAAALAPIVLDRRPQRIVAVNVAGPDAMAALAEWSRTRFALPVRNIDARAAHPALRTRYAEPGRLGADRWAAVVGGFLSHGACVVADLGTAATIDFVDAAGTHRGGYIVPGLDAMRAALANGTHGVQVEDVEVAPGAWGTATGAAVAAGARRALAALIDSCAREPGSAGATVVLTGGDAERVAPWVGCHHRVDHELVLRGAVALADASPEGAA